MFFVKDFSFFETGRLIFISRSYKKPPNFEIHFAFDVTNRDIANSFNVLYQTTLLIFKGDTEVYRSIGEVTEDLIYQALKASI